MSGVKAGLAGAFLTIDLDAVVTNWRLLCAKAGGAACAAVVKADAYGLGAAEIAPALRDAGCRDFFVALPEEGLDVRAAVGKGPRIFVLNGTPTGAEADFIAGSLIPVVNTLGELAGWRAHAAHIGRAVPVALQLDTGMTRLGLSAGDTAAIAADASLLDGIEVELVVSHLACADEPEHPANAAQLTAFRSMRRDLPASPASLANSPGIFLGADYHFDLARPGAALYGINPTPASPNPMRQAVSLSARVIQVRDVAAGAGIGYGHTVSAERPARLATISLGYADGWPRNASMCAFFSGVRLPFAGRVSMDSIILDATNAPASLAEGDCVDLICAEQTIDEIATAAGTIGYEILTRLGNRFHRRYVKPATATA